MKNVQPRNMLRVLTAVLLLGVTCPALHAQSTPPFIVLDNTYYPNSTSVFDAAGTLRATVMYSQSTWPGTCTSTGCANAPTESEFKSKVTAYVDEFGSSNVIVFDYEDLVLSAEASTAAAENAVALFQEMIGWAREVYPNAKIGLYDYDYSSTYDPNSSSGYNTLRATLFNGSTDSFDFFAPTMYQRWSTHAIWDQNLAQAIINDSAINQANGLSLPIYPYFSPYTSGDTSSSLLADSEFQSEISDMTACAVASSSACQTILASVTAATGDCTKSGSDYSCSPVLGGILWTNGTSDVSPTASWVMDVLAILSPPVSANGTYEIVSTGQSGACVDGNSTTGSTSTDACTQSSSQEWAMTASTNGTYAIQNYGYQQANLNTGNNEDWTDSSSTLDLASVLSGGTVSAAQEWQVISLRNGYYEFVELGDYATSGNTDSEECLTASSSGLTTARCNGSTSQVFQMPFVVGSGSEALGDTADAYINNGSDAGNNYGANSYVPVENGATGYTREAYLKFDVSGVSGAVTKATVSLVPITVTGTDVNAAYLVTDNSWTGTGITWDNAPAFSTTQLATWSISPSSVGFPILFDVTSSAASAQNSGGLLSIGIDAPSASNYVAYGSRRNSTVAYQPMLIVTTE